VAQRPCLHKIARSRLCGVLSDRRRCPTHRLAEGRAKQARRPDFDHAERQRRARLVHQHIEAYGLVCPGWRRPPHPVDPAAGNRLTADHVWAVAAGGPEDGPLQVLCRKCNSARGARAATTGEDRP